MPWMWQKGRGRLYIIFLNSARSATAMESAAYKQVHTYTGLKISDKRITLNKHPVAKQRRNKRLSLIEETAKNVLINHHVGSKELNIKTQRSGVSAIKRDFVAKQPIPYIYLSIYQPIYPCLNLYLSTKKENSIQ